MENGRRYVLIGAALTVVLVAMIAGWMVVRHYSYGKEWVDYDRYYRTDEGAAVFMDDAQTSWRALYQYDRMYLTLDMVKSELNDRFYLSPENILMYTLPGETVEIMPGQRMWTIGGSRTQTDWPVTQMIGDEFYIAAEFVAMFTDIHLETHTEPERLLITVGSGSETWAQITKDAQVRTQPGRKELILSEVSAGDEVCVLGAGEDWTKVRTADGFIGYLPTKSLGELLMKSHITEMIEQDYTGVRMSQPICLAWHQVFVEEANQNLTDLLEETTGITVISPTWFALSDDEGNFTSYAEKWYVDEVHERGMQVWGLVNDFNTSVNKYRLLSRMTSRRKLISNLINAALEVGLDGINIDFEQIDKETGEHYIQFIRELSVECRKNGLVLSVDNYSPVGGRVWYHVPEQGVVADYVIMMGYDEHWSGGPEGSTASITFTTDTIRMTLAQVPADKFIHGIPFYTRVWGEENGVNISSVAAGMVSARELLEEHDAKLKWLDEEGQYFGEYMEDGVKYSIWLEDEASLRLKLDAIRDAELAGVACWKLGLEDTSIWPVIAGYLR